MSIVWSLDGLYGSDAVPSRLEEGGPLSTLESIDLPPEQKQIIGSGIVIVAPSAQDVKNLIEGDIYWRENVVGFTLGLKA